MFVTLNATSRKIVGHLLAERSPISVTDLALRVGCSPRAVRYQISNLRQWFEAYGACLRAGRKGISLVASDERRKRLRAIACEADSYVNKYSARERQSLLLKALAGCTEPIRLDTLMDLLGVSKSTALKDLNRLRSTLERYNLKLQSARTKGYCLSGSESRIRQLLADHVILGYSEAGRETDDARVAADEGSIWNLAIGTVARVFSDPGEAEAFLRGLVSTAESRLGVRFAGGTSRALVVHLAIFISRLLTGHAVTMPPAELSALRESGEYEVVRELADAVASRLGIHIPEAETAFLAVHFACAKRSAGGRSPGLVLRGFLRAVASEMARAAQAFISKKLTDRELVEGLSVHLESVYQRLKHNLPIRNPLLDDVKRRYPLFYDAAVECGKVFSSLTSLSLPEEELGYIAMHIGAAFERASQETAPRKRIVVVCSSGLGTTKMLSSQIVSAFPSIEIVGTASAEEAQGIEPDDVDAVVSTVPLQLRNVPCVVVRPLLDRRDMELIEGLLSLIAQPPTTLGLSNQPAIGPLRLKRSAVRFNVACADWTDAIRTAGKILRKQGFCTRQYGEAMVRQINTYGSYVVVRGGLALPHARPEDGVLKAGMCLIRLGSPVYFPNLPEEPVWTVIGLALTERLDPRRLDLVTDLVLHGEPEKLAQAQTEEELLALLGNVMDHEGGRTA
ncbi:MAG: PRD domain-containing protein [Firmicutes bacterium]|jgi:transcriptional antiterminator/mannitol/fructose-specific phosphotransferase system IIA component (Ntr-type)|nr:PRD domain-containing protein [Bacillota bacterium]